MPETRCSPSCELRRIVERESWKLVYRSLYILTFLKFNPFERDIFSIFFLYESYIDQIENPSVRKKK